MVAPLCTAYVNSRATSSRLSATTRVRPPTVGGKLVSLLNHHVSLLIRNRRATLTKSRRVAEACHSSLHKSCSEIGLIASRLALP